MEDFGPFGLGPWSVEPDFEEWVDKATGYTCTVKRHAHLGHLCGYVDVPAEIVVTDELFLPVHGGVTYNTVNPDTQMRRVGFDCGHAGDLTPKLVQFREKTGRGGPPAGWREPKETYRTFDYVKEQCTELALQLRALQTAAGR